MGSFPEGTGPGQDPGAAGRALLPPDSPFLLRCRISFASFSVMPAGATTRSSLFVMICKAGSCEEGQLKTRPPQGLPLAPKTTIFTHYPNHPLK